MKPIVRCLLQLLTALTAVTSFAAFSGTENENAGLRARIYSASCESISSTVPLPKDYGILVASVMVDRGNPAVMRVWSRKLPFYAPLAEISELCRQIDTNLDYECFLITVESDDLNRGGIITGMRAAPASACP